MLPSFISNTNKQLPLIFLLKFLALPLKNQFPHQTEAQAHSMEWLLLYKINSMEIVVSASAIQDYYYKKPVPPRNPLLMHVLHPVELELSQCSCVVRGSITTWWLWCTPFGCLHCLWADSVLQWIADLQPDMVILYLWLLFLLEMSAIPSS